jgi:hypothetical protein
MEKIRMHKKMAMTGKSPVGYSKKCLKKLWVKEMAGKAVGRIIKVKNLEDYDETCW